MFIKDNPRRFGSLTGPGAMKHPRPALVLDGPDGTPQITTKSPNGIRTIRLLLTRAVDYAAKVPSQPSARALLATKLTNTVQSHSSMCFTKHSNASSHPRNFAFQAVSWSILVQTETSL